MSDDIKVGDRVCTFPYAAPLSKRSNLTEEVEVVNIGPGDWYQVRFSNGYEAIRGKGTVVKIENVKTKEDAPSLAPGALFTINGTEFYRVLLCARRECSDGTLMTVEAEAVQR